MKLFLFLLLSGIVEGCIRNKPPPPKFTNCGSPIRNLTMLSSFIIDSPITSQGKYPPRADCKWNFNVVKDCIPVLNCSQFEIVNSLDCIKDFLRVFESNSNSLRLCGLMDNLIPLIVESSSLKTTFYNLSFISDGAKEGAGFKCVVSCKAKSTCMTTKPTMTTTISKEITTTVASTPKPTQQVHRECDCVGNSRSRIVGGVEARKNQLIWQAALKYDGSFLCGGSLIGPSFVLTASHCTRHREASRFQVLLGRHDITKSSEPGGEKRNVSHIFIHPHADPLTLNFDFALLKLSSPLDLTTNTIGAVCLPRDDKNKFEQRSVIASGWGTRAPDKIELPAILNMVELKTTNGSCGEYSSDEITENMLCAFSSGKDACQGDRGGPLVLKQDQRPILVGVISWGKGCSSSPRFPGVYARVSKVLKWISTTTGGKICS